VGVAAVVVSTALVGRPRVNSGCIVFTVVRECGRAMRCLVVLLGACEVWLLGGDDALGLLRD
jgi:hypothetical protein